MTRAEFHIGQEFWCGGKRWRCTDIGTRVITAVCLEPHEIVTIVPNEYPATPGRQTRSMAEDPAWFNGPPYAVDEVVFDEYDMQACSRNANAEAS